MASVVKNLACNTGDLSLIPGLGRSGGGPGNLLQYSGLFFLFFLSFFFFLIEVVLTYSSVILSGRLHHDSVIFTVYNSL